MSWLRAGRCPDRGGQAMGWVGWSGQEGGCPVSAHPLGHLSELKGYFSVFSCSYGERSPAVVSSCFSPKCWGEEGGLLALCRWDSSPPAQYGGRWSGSSTNQSRQALFKFLCSLRADGNTNQLGRGLGGGIALCGITKGHQAPKGSFQALLTQGRGLDQKQVGDSPRPDFVTASSRGL